MRWQGHQLVGGGAGGRGECYPMDSGQQRGVSAAVWARKRGLLPYPGKGLTSWLSAAQQRVLRRWSQCAVVCVGCLCVLLLSFPPFLRVAFLPAARVGGGGGAPFPPTLAVFFRPTWSDLDVFSVIS